MEISTIGSGSMAQSLGQSFLKAGHNVMFGTRDQEKLSDSLTDKLRDAKTGTYSEAAKFGDVVLIVKGWSEITDAVGGVAEDLKNKMVIDCSNPEGHDEVNGYHLVVGHNTSGAEEIAKIIPDAKMVKTFNHVYGSMLKKGTIFGENRASVFYCGDDEKAKEVVASLAKDIGLDPIDAGGLKVARVLEPLAALLVELAENQKWGGENIAFKLLQR